MHPNNLCFHLLAYVNSKICVTYVHVPHRDKSKVTTTITTATKMGRGLWEGEVVGGDGETFMCVHFLPTKEFFSLKRRGHFRSCSSLATLGYSQRGGN